jgi:NADPH:quinone reductase-like Zn-dependent oxidoreductase
LKALYATAYGGPEVMRLGDLPDPVPESGQVLIQVRAASVNPVDWKLRNGDGKMFTRFHFPKVMGTDFAGTVLALGEDVAGIEVGASVYGYIVAFSRADGTHAELLVIQAGSVYAMPEGLSFEQAASLPVAALTALNGLRQCGDLSGKSVIVNGATGGVGHFALQIAKAKGAETTAVCSAKNAGVAADLGADAVIDYAQSDFTLGTMTYDVIFDAHAHLGFEKAKQVLAKDGFYVTPLPLPGVILRSWWQRMLGGPRIILDNVRGKPEDYAELDRLIQAGHVKPLVDHVFPLSEAAKAYAAQEGGGIAGKVVIRMN